MKPLKIISRASSYRGIEKKKLNHNKMRREKMTKKGDEKENESFLNNFVG
jgi:hypothetical protein